MLFSYRALLNNKIKKGNIEADSVSAVVEHLRNRNYFPIEVKEKKSAGQITVFNSIFDRITFTDIVDFTRQIAIMLNAGLTLVDSLEILKKQVTKESLKKIIISIDGEIKGGNSFSDALKKHSQYFSNLYISLVKSGEASGKLGDITLKLADNLEKEREFKGKLKGALIYPVIVVVGMLGVMFVMVTFVVPKLLNLYKDFNIELPVTTQILIVISGFTSKFWPLIIGGIFGLVTLFKQYMRTRNGKLSVDAFMLKLPYLGSVLKMSLLVDSTRTLSILINSGVSILERRRHFSAYFRSDDNGWRENRTS
ncbi:MAG: Tfp pilus biogenesis protein PilC [Candidatus Roizmanbacteria bacterium GW2011_GWA2_36_23]|uniref:Tfp pilus biogenesis protein PilC n=1 Tax=Candidatus Roizmanbacteria bacterium GW2011_GWA2_36_23 TaxID=1618480 RepID=A0A0G0E794_9BACT|nr:MAG: Tfp pilus biogenesis protein PilC [Candidatus Roizmanbacteria bacterium GW2011_GWA2_36_23]